MIALPAVPVSPIEAAYHERNTPGKSGGEASGGCVLVIFGLTGDLAQRKLIPALYHLALTGALPARLLILGISRSASDPITLRQSLKESTARYYRKREVNDEVWAAFSQRIHCLAGSTEAPETFAKLAAFLPELEAAHGLSGPDGAPANRLFYLSVGPDLFAGILKQLKSFKLIQPVEEDRELPYSRVIIEKPFGRDLASAHALNTLVAQALDERQVYRIDHYLGKETVQNLMVFRFANAIFEPLWNSHYIERIEVTAVEELLVEGRGAFYDRTGVIRDIVQNHLLQLLALILMEPPITLNADDIRTQKVNAIRAILPIDPKRDVVYGQFEGYTQTPGVSAESRTPTYVAMKLGVDNWRWNGVPIYLRAGKGICTRMTEIVITFRGVPSRLFGLAKAPERPNMLVLRIQPNEGIYLRFASKLPGEDLSIGEVAMDFAYARAFDKKPGEAYERLLLDAMRGDATLFMRRDEVEEAWRLIDPVTRFWEANDALPILYKRGTEGPEEANRLISRDGYRWHTLK